MNEGIKIKINKAWLFEENKIKKTWHKSYRILLFNLK